MTDPTYLVCTVLLVGACMDFFLLSSAMAPSRLIPEPSRLIPEQVTPSPDRDGPEGDFLVHVVSI